MLTVLFDSSTVKPAAIHFDRRLYCLMLSPLFVIVIILTYDRTELLQQQLAQFNGLPYLHKVLVIWNNPKYPPPTLQWPHIHVNIQVSLASCLFVGYVYMFIFNTKLPSVTCI